jgi:hypothetical protein
MVNVNFLTAHFEFVNHRVCTPPVGISEQRVFCGRNISVVQFVIRRITTPNPGSVRIFLRKAGHIWLALFVFAEKSIVVLAPTNIRRKRLTTSTNKFPSALPLALFAPRTAFCAFKAKKPLPLKS